MKQPQLVVLDYETALTTGEASVEFYRDDFRATSAALTFLYEDNSFDSIFLQGEEAIGAELAKLHASKLPVWVYNLQFEMGVTQCRFPSVSLHWGGDIMRLVQVYDNGNKHEEFSVDSGLDEDDVVVAAPVKKVNKIGFSLSAAVYRILDKQFHGHKDEAHDYIRRNVVGCRNPGAHLHILPPDILERYNIGDTENTLRLYIKIIEDFKQINYKWQVDHDLYMRSVRLLVQSKIRGVKVDIQALQDYIPTIEKEVADIYAQFRGTFSNEIKEVELEKLNKLLATYKTEKGRTSILSRFESNDTSLLFNVGSAKQLESLFVDKLELPVSFRTPTGRPSFRANHLEQWGEGGKILINRKKRLLVANQANKLIAKAGYDSRWHIDLKAVGTATGRLAGGGGLNAQGMARRDPGLMSAIVADPGELITSNDVTSGEPSIITHLTGDSNYRYFCFDGVGIKPYYKGDILMIDDIYLAYASTISVFKRDIKKAFEASYDGVQGYDMWLIDPERIKGALKFQRKHAKWQVLGFGYGLGPKNLFNKAIEAGFPMTKEQCYEAYKSYWALFPDIAAYRDYLQAKFIKDGYLVNLFGYRLTPNEDRKAFNYNIQSAVNGLMTLYISLLLEDCDYARYIAIIHDELVSSCVSARIQDYRGKNDTAVKELNEMLGWSIPVRFGFVPGRNFYEAK